MIIASGKMLVSSLEHVVSRCNVHHTCLLDSLRIVKGHPMRNSGTAIMTGYKEGLATACEGITMDLVSGKAADLAPKDAAVVSLYSRYLKRIAAHSRNIVTSVVNPFHRIGYREKTLPQ